MRIGITGKMSLIVLAIVLASAGTVIVASYWNSYRQVKEAAGIELIGCANITTGLIDPGDLKRLAEGDLSLTDNVERAIGWTTDKKPIFKSHYILSLDGTILAADEALKSEGFKPGDRFYLDAEALEMIRTMKHPAYSDVYEYGGTERMTGYAPIYENFDPNGRLIAINAIDFDAGILEERTWEMVRSILVIGSILPFIAAGITLLVVRRTIAPLKRVNEQVDRVAGGDFTSLSLDIRSRDEAGQLLRNFNRMVGDLSALARGMTETSSRLGEASRELTQAAALTGESSRQIASAVEEVAGGASRQAERAGTLIEMVEQARREILSSNDQARTAAAFAVESAEAAKRGESAIRGAVEHLDGVARSVRLAADSIQRLGRRSEEIEDIVTAITDISGRTDLLALNAAIEAARAGVHGKGFAVVAGEVRKLAEQSKSSANRIADLVRHIQSETISTVRSMEHTLEAFDRQTIYMDEGGEALAMMVGQVLRTEQSVRDMQQISEYIARFIQEVIEATSEFASFIEETAASSQEVSASAQEQSASSLRMAAQALALADIASALDERVRKFKIQ